MPTEPGSVKHMAPPVRPLWGWLGGHTSLTSTIKQEHQMPHSHRFDQISGWCSCGLRDDGRLLIRSDIVRQAPGYQPALQDRLIDQTIQTMKDATP